MTAIETKTWVAEKLCTFTVAKDGYLPKLNTANTKIAMTLGFERIAFRTNYERQWSFNIPGKTSFEQLMLRKSDGKLFTLIDDVLIEWARRFDSDAEKIILKGK